MNIPTPKEVFAAGKNAKSWLELTEGEMWREAIHAALTQMTLGTNGGDPSFATKIQGAKEFAITLTNLAEPKAKSVAQPRQNLNHKV